MSCFIVPNGPNGPCGPSGPNGALLLPVSHHADEFRFSNLRFVCLRPFLAIENIGYVHKYPYQRGNQPEKTGQKAEDAI